MVGDQRLVEVHTAGLIDLGGQKVTHTHVQLAADGELFYGIVIPIGLVKVLVGHGVQVHQIPGLGLRQHRRALHQGHIKGTVPGNGGVLDLIHRLLRFYDVDVQPVLYRNVPVEDGRGNAVPRVFGGGHVYGGEPVVGFGIGVENVEGVAFEIRFRQVVRYLGLLLGLAFCLFCGYVRRVGDGLLCGTLSTADHTGRGHQQCQKQRQQLLCTHGRSPFEYYKCKIRFSLKQSIARILYINHTTNPSLCQGIYGKTAKFLPEM